MQSKWDLAALIATGCMFVTSALTGLTQAEAADLTVTVAVTTELPEETLLSLSREAQKTGARLVVRGLALTRKEKDALTSRGHFAQSPSVQDQNRALIRTGFLRLAAYAKKGIVFTVDPVFFRDRSITYAPTVVFALGNREMHLTGFTCIASAAHYGAKKTDDATFQAALLQYAGDAP